MSTASVRTSRNSTRDVAEALHPVQPSARGLSPAQLLPVELTARVADACTWSVDPKTRSAALAELVQEVYETTLWRMHGDETSQIEMASLRRGVAEVDAHRWRMGLTCERRSPAESTRGTSVVRSARDGS